MIHFDKVCKRYPGAGEALIDISFHIDPGEMAFLTGHSGAGKSTLLKLIAAMERCSRGTLLFNGRNLNTLSRRSIPHLRREIGIIFQDYRLLYERTVFDNVALPLLISGYSRKNAARRVRAALDKVGLLSRETSMPLTLSGGEQQRVGIARAVVNKPPLLLADEPTGNLDPRLSAEIMKLFMEFNSLGTTVLIASHDLALIKRLGRRVIVLDHGKLTHDIKPKTVHPA